MGKIISCSICVNDIPQECMTIASNGKKYLNFVVDEKLETDQYGKTHSVYIQQSKEQREAKESKIYIGNGKEFVFGSTPENPTNSNEPSRDAQKAGFADGTDLDTSLPF